MANIRHGDLALVEVKELPKGLEEADSKVILEGRSNKHLFDNGKLYLKTVDEFVFGYFATGNNTHIFHPEHGKANGKGMRRVKVKKGIYELRAQHEDTHEGMKQVVD